MKVKIDENLPLEACALFRDAGFDALSVHDQRLTGAPDPEIYAVCQREGRVLITLDVGFADIGTYLPASAAGIIVLRLRLQSRPAVLSVIRLVIPLLARERIAGRLWIVDERRGKLRSWLQVHVADAPASEPFKPSTMGISRFSTAHPFNSAVEQ